MAPPRPPVVPVPGSVFPVSDDPMVTQAIIDAASAKQGLSAHEILCGERYRHIAESMAESKTMFKDGIERAETAIKDLTASLEESRKERAESMRRLYDRIGTWNAGGIVVLLGVIGFLFVKAYG